MRTLLFLVFLAVCAEANAYAAESAPDWVMELSSRTLSAYPSEVHSVTLLTESHTTVDASGKRTLNSVRLSVLSRLKAETTPSRASSI